MYTHTLSLSLSFSLSLCLSRGQIVRSSPIQQMFQIISLCLLVWWPCLFEWRDTNSVFNSTISFRTSLNTRSFSSTISFRTTANIHSFSSVWCGVWSPSQLGIQCQMRCDSLKFNLLTGSHCGADCCGCS